MRCCFSYMFSYIQLLLFWRKPQISNSSSFFFSAVVRTEILACGLLSNTSFCIICFSGINFTIRCSITEIAQLLTSVWTCTSQLPRTDIFPEKWLLFSDFHLN